LAVAFLPKEREADVSAGLAQSESAYDRFLIGFDDPKQRSECPVAF
jgi:hypothetical protein